MADTVGLSIPRDLYVRRVIQDLHTMQAGMGKMGMCAPALAEAAERLADQALEIERYRATDPYTAGHTDGYAAAFATGLPGQQKDVSDG